MTRTEPTLETVFILHARQYRDTSAILDVFSKESGRYSVVVRGARSKRSRLKGLLEPFIPLLLASIGRGELKTSTTVERAPGAFRLSGESLMLGLYVNELLYRLLGRFDPMPDLFQHYEHLLEDLQSAGEGTLESLRAFELLLLQSLGYGINFYYDARTGGEISENENYVFRVNEGFQPASDDDDLVFPGNELLHIAAGRLNDVDANRLRHLTRSSLATLLGGKPLKSRSLFNGRSSVDMDEIAGSSSE